MECPNSRQRFAGAAGGDRAGHVPHVARQVGGQPAHHAQPQAARRRRRLRAVRARRLGRDARLPRASARAQRRARLLAQVLALGARVTRHTPETLYLPYTMASAILLYPIAINHKTRK